MIKMSFFNKLYDITRTDMFKHIFRNLNLFFKRMPETDSELNSQNSHKMQNIQLYKIIIAPCKEKP